MSTKQHENYTYTFSIGANVPLTKEGNIMVDGVLASCYPSADHDFGPFYNDTNPMVS